MSLGQAPRPRDLRSMLSVTRPPAVSMTCRRASLNSGPRRTRRSGANASCRGVWGSARGSISRRGCRMKPAMGISRASERIMAMCTVVMLKTRRSGRAEKGSSAPSSSLVAQWYMQPSLGKNSTSERESMNACSALECWPQRMINRGRYSPILFMVSPPLGLKRRVRSGSPTRPAFTNRFQQSSVTMVTWQLQCMIRPRARATKGCTSPRVPRVSSMTRNRRSEVAGAMLAEASSEQPRGLPGLDPPLTSVWSSRKAGHRTLESNPERASCPSAASVQSSP
mmetsp:Transcript_69403/g.206760  ORF Transcript_69403/g.206760 Transcript_69403/m.206760 type:complete len:281 (-) Transcript_69403:473-1315(-)